MNIKVIFSESNDIEMSVVFSESSQSIDADFGEIQTVNLSALPVYKGDYGVTPTVSGQTMRTKGMAMLEDVTIHPIPFYNVSNMSGGNTVYIARDM